ncbi:MULTISPECIES: GAF domain-containing protein [Paenibacillus]|uniref:GAF domain-containing protein n=1 Tax=Paenibacillus TaxID=44249 RepID=UPI0022B8D45B|nr:GAF domain-containing protein [Paenibacillus caseinilyticus]MCZ8518181.1 GAF domain-containing protein [Paenibacillus caseinilyticus]
MKKIQELFDRLRTETGSDFVGIAVTDGSHRQGRWIGASGSQNDRYRHMVLKPGRGLAGTALLTARSVTGRAGSRQRASGDADCPLMLAEGLSSAAAVPIRHLGRMLGVLYVGMRQEHEYTPFSLTVLEARAETIGGQLRDGGFTGEPYRNHS